MPFLAIGGFPVPVQDGSASLSTVRQGQKSRSPSGLLRTSQRDDRLEMAGVTRYYATEDADAFEGLVNGRGHVFHFQDGLQSFTGLQPEPNYAGLTIDTGAATANINGSLDITQGSFRLRYNAQLGHNWTVQWREYDGADWSIATLTAGGLSYLDGAATAGVGSTATALAVEVLDGVVRLSYSGSGTLDKLADLVVLPYNMTAEMVQPLHATNYNFSPLPMLKLSGGALPQPMLAVGQVASSSVVQGNVNGSWENNLRQVSFLLSPDEAYSEPF